MNFLSDGEFFKHFFSDDEVIGAQLNCALRMNIGLNIVKDIYTYSIVYIV